MKVETVFLIACCLLLMFFINVTSAMPVKGIEEKLFAANPGCCALHLPCCPMG
jgi:hypothetical protein